jgi:hypothetical protein
VDQRFGQLNEDVLDEAAGNQRGDAEGDRPSVTPVRISAREIAQCEPDHLSKRRSYDGACHRLRRKASTIGIRDALNADRCLQPCSSPRPALATRQRGGG